jgi:uncharacterized membrane protein
MGYLYPIIYGDQEGSAGKAGIAMAIIVLIFIVVLFLVYLLNNLSGGIIK